MTKNTEIAEKGSGEAIGNTEKHCYVCWENSNEGDLGELHRDCGCRGENGHVHMSCLITAKKASSNALEPLTRSWLKCNQCQVPYADPTKQELIRAMDPDTSLRKRLLCTCLNLLGKLPGLIRLYTLLPIYIGIYALFYVMASGAVVLLPPHVKQLYQTSSLESRVTCALFFVALLWKYRHPLCSFLRSLAREVGRRIGREIYFNFWFAVEGLGANNLSTLTKVCTFAGLVAIGYLRIRDRGTFDFPFHIKPRARPEESRFRNMVRYLFFYARETGYWAIFDTYQTSIAILFLLGWAIYLLMVGGIIGISLALYEHINDETIMNSAFVTDHVLPFINGECNILDAFRQAIGE